MQGVFEGVVVMALDPREPGHGRNIVDQCRDAFIHLLTQPCGVQRVTPADPFEFIARAFQCARIGGEHGTQAGAGHFPVKPGREIGQVQRRSGLGGADRAFDVDQAFGRIDEHMAAQGAQLVQHVPVFDQKALQQKRGAQPGTIQTAHKHPDPQQGRRHFQCGFVDSLCVLAHIRRPVENKV